MLRLFYTSYEKEILLKFKADPRLPESWKQLERMEKEGLIIRPGKALYLTEKGVKARRRVENESIIFMRISIGIASLSIMMATISLVMGVLK